MKHAWEARARELAHLHAVLAARRPALVVLTGAPGMGKTTLLETWAAPRDRARLGGRRRRRLPPAGGDGPSTDERGFRAALLAATCETDDGARRARARATVSRSAGAPPHARSAAQRARPARAVPGPARRLLPEPAVRGVVRGRLPAGAAALRRAPWSSGSRCAVRTASSDYADRVVALGKLAPADVHAALASLGDALRPPLAPHELEVYAQRGPRPRRARQPDARAAAGGRGMSASASSLFDPDSFVDRVAEQALFHRLLRFEDDARVLTIQDGRGRGKSHLLRLLRASVQVRQPGGGGLLRRARRALAVRSVLVHGRGGAGAERVRRDRPARPARGRGAALRSPDGRARRPARARRDRHAWSAGATVAGISVGGDLVINAPPPTSDLALQERLRDEATKAFRRDLRALSAERSVVLLVDAFEASAQELADWIHGLLHERARSGGDKLVLVLAGQRISTATLKLMLGARFARCRALGQRALQLGARPRAGRARRARRPALRRRRRRLPREQARGRPPDRPDGRQHRPVPARGGRVMSLASFIAALDESGDPGPRARRPDRRDRRATASSRCSSRPARCRGASTRRSSACCAGARTTSPATRGCCASSASTRSSSRARPAASSTTTASASLCSRAFATERRDALRELTGRLVAHFEAAHADGARLEEDAARVGRIVQQANFARYRRLAATLETRLLTPLLEAVYQLSLVSSRDALAFLERQLASYEDSGRYTVCRVLIGGARDVVSGLDGRMPTPARCWSGSRTGTGGCSSGWSAPSGPSACSRPLCLGDPARSAAAAGGARRARAGAAAAVPAARGARDVRGGGLGGGGLRRRRAPTATCGWRARRCCSSSRPRRSCSSARRSPLASDPRALVCALTELADAELRCGRRDEALASRAARARPGADGAARRCARRTWRWARSCRPASPRRTRCCWTPSSPRPRRCWPGSATPSRSSGERSSARGSCGSAGSAAGAARRWRAWSTPSCQLGWPTSCARSSRSSAAHSRSRRSATPTRSRTSLDAADAAAGARRPGLALDAAAPARAGARRGRTRRRGRRRARRRRTPLGRLRPRGLGRAGRRPSWRRCSRAPATASAPTR